MREVGLEHVEAQLAGHGRVVAAHEAEPRLGVDEAADQPRAGDPVDVDAAPRDPRPPAHVRARRFPAPPSSWGAGARMDRVRGVSTRSAAAGAEEVQLHDLGQPLTKTNQRGLGRLSRSRLLSTAARGGLQRAGLAAQQLVVGVARGVEERLHGIVGKAFDEARFADRRVATAGHDLAPDPLEVLERLLVPRQHVDGVLDRNRAEPLQTPADLDPQVARIRRDLVDQDEPAARPLRSRGNDNTTEANNDSVCHRLWRLPNHCLGAGACYLRKPSCSPPSTGITWPVVLRKRAESRRKTASAWSSGSIGSRVSERFA